MKVTRTVLIPMAVVVAIFFCSGEKNHGIAAHWEVPEEPIKDDDTSITLTLL